MPPHSSYDTSLFPRHLFVCRLLCPLCPSSPLWKENRAKLVAPGTPRSPSAMGAIWLAGFWSEALNLTELAGTHGIIGRWLALPLQVSVSSSGKWVSKAHFLEPGPMGKAQHPFWRLCCIQANLLPLVPTIQGEFSVYSLDRPKKT